MLAGDDLASPPPSAPRTRLSSMHEATSEPLSPQDREEILVDLADLEVFQTLLEPRGIRGLVVDCGECEAPHYFAWELLRQNLRQLLDVGQLRAHEPAYEPDPADYVAWDYASGFVDGVLSESERDDGSDRDGGPSTIDLR
jgi:Family of unknown function (DUF5319)